MRRTLYAIASLAIISIVACNKKDEDIDNVPDKGGIRFINRSADLYDIYLDEFHYGELYGDDTSIYYKIITGTHRVMARQKANIIDTPKLRQQIIIIYKDSVSTFIFP